MALDARHRASLYGKFAELLGEDDANALMTEFPSIEADELVTKQFLRAELAELRSEFRRELTGLRSELSGEIADGRSETLSLRAEMADRFRRQTIWTASGFAATNAITLTALSILA